MNNRQEFTLSTSIYPNCDRTFQNFPELETILWVISMESHKEMNLGYPLSFYVDNSSRTLLKKQFDVLRKWN